MHRFVVCAVATLLIPGPVATFGAGDDARALIERAVQAQGGEAQVAKLTRAWRADIKGTQGKLLITGTTIYQAPGQIRTSAASNWRPSLQNTRTASCTASRRSRGLRSWRGSRPGNSASRDGRQFPLDTAAPAPYPQSGQER